MLNKASVDLEQEPLGDYENGALYMDDEGMEEARAATTRRWRR
jgi:hypothetical protein